MNITLSGEITAQLLTLLRRDAKLARTVASQLIATVSKGTLASYLLSSEMALELLTERLKSEPQRTVRELGRLAHGESQPRSMRRGLARGRRSQLRREVGSIAALSGGKVRRGVRRRKRLSSDQVDHLRTEVRAYLTKKPWSSRKQLTSAVQFPSQAIYNRIMSELKDAGEVVQHGEKSKTTYAIKGG